MADRKWIPISEMSKYTPAFLFFFLVEGVQEYGIASDYPTATHYRQRDCTFSALGISGCARCNGGC